MPIGEKHTQAVFEAATGYLPAEFERFWKYNPQSKSMEPLSDGPGEQRYPVVLATQNGSHAMGIYSPEPRREGFGPPVTDDFDLPHKRWSNGIVSFG